MAKRVSIINFKGGVGKTTLTFHIGAGLARYYDARVLLVDMDHQSSLSITCMKAHLWQQNVEKGQTISEIFRSFIGQESIGSGHDIIVKSPMQNSYPRYSYHNMDIIPADLNLDDIEIELTASHQGNAIKSEWVKRTLLCQWFQENKIDECYDYIIFDCPPATKIVTQNAIAASHGYVIPVVPEAVMERGAPHLEGMMEGIDSRLKSYVKQLDSKSRSRTSNIYIPDTKLIGLAVTRIRSSSSGYLNDHAQHLRSLEKTWKDKLIKPYIPDGAGVLDAMTSSIPVYDASFYPNVRNRHLDKIYQDLVCGIKIRIDKL